MLKIYLSILFVILIRNKVIQSVPFNDDESQDIMVASSRLHRTADQFYQRTNGIPDVEYIPPNDFIPHYRRTIDYAVPRQVKIEEPETVFVDMNIDYDEQLETQYVDLFIE